MLAKILSYTREKKIDESSSHYAGQLFARGKNCAQSVFQATTGRDDSEIMEMAKALGGGIGDRKCLCGAVTGGVMALGISGKGHLAGELVDRFRETQGMTCCAGLTRNLKWGSKEHKANCRRITEETTAMVEELLNG